MKTLVQTPEDILIFCKEIGNKETPGLFPISLQKMQILSTSQEFGGTIEKTSTKPMASDSKTFSRILKSNYFKPKYATSIQIMRLFTPKSN